MKRIILGAALLLSLSAKLKAGDVNRVDSTEFLPPTNSSVSYNGGSVYGHIPSGGAGVGNCLTDFEVKISSVHGTGAFVLFYPYTFSIIDGTIASGTTIYQVNVTTYTLDTNYRVRENRTLQTAICGTPGLPMNINLLAPTTNYRVNMNYQGYRRKNQ